MRLFCYLSFCYLIVCVLLFLVLLTFVVVPCAREPLYSVLEQRSQRVVVAVDECTKYTILVYCDPFYEPVLYIHKFSRWFVFHLELLLGYCSPYWLNKSL